MNSEDTKRDSQNEFLVLAAIQGDEKALNALLKRWQQPLWNYLRSLCHNDSDAWDLLQKTFLSIARGIRKLRDPAAFPKWAYTLASRRYADSVKSDLSRKRTQQTLSSFTETTPSEAHHNDSERMRIALDALPTRDRQLLCQAYLEDIPHRDLAVLLGVPLGTIKSRLFAARKKLKQYLNQYS